MQVARTVCEEKGEKHANCCLALIGLTIGELATIYIHCTEETLTDDRMQRAPPWILLQQGT